MPDTSVYSAVFTGAALGDELDVTGLILEVSWSDGSEEKIDVTKDMVTGFDSKTVGKQTLTVTYKDWAGVYEVEVNAEGNKNGAVIPTTAPKDGSIEDELIVTETAQDNAEGGENNKEGKNIDMATSAGGDSTDTDVSANEKTANALEKSDESNAALWIILVIVFILLAGAFFVILFFKKRKKDEDKEEKQ